MAWWHMEPGICTRRDNWQSDLWRMRDQYIPLLGSPGQVKLPVGQVDLSIDFFHILYKQIINFIIVEVGAVKHLRYVEPWGLMSNFVTLFCWVQGILGTVITTIMSMCSTCKELRTQFMFCFCPYPSWRRLGDKPLSEPMLAELADAYMPTLPQWVNP